jgi:hypothetical protein
MANASLRSRNVLLTFTPKVSRQILLFVINRSHYYHISQTNIYFSTFEALCVERQRSTQTAKPGTSSKAIVEKGRPARNQIAEWRGCCKH